MNSLFKLRCSRQGQMILVEKCGFLSSQRPYSVGHDLSFAEAEPFKFEGLPAPPVSECIDSDTGGLYNYSS